jgi:hypothetical protein
MESHRNFQESKNFELEAPDCAWAIDPLMREFGVSRLVHKDLFEINPNLSFLFRI